MSPAATYIAERMSKRAAGMSIAEHIPYAPTQASLSYLGLRNIGTQTLALIGVGQKVMVMPIQGSAVAAFSRLKNGDPIIMQQGRPTAEWTDGPVGQRSPHLGRVGQGLFTDSRGKLATSASGPTWAGSCPARDQPATLTLSRPSERLLPRYTKLRYGW